MALTEYIGIRGAIGTEPFQGKGAASVTVQAGDQSTTTTTTTVTDTETDITTPDFGDGWGVDTPVTQDTLPELLKQAFFIQDGENLISIFRKAWLYNDPGDPAFKSILKTALLYTKNAEGKQFLESILNDRLKDLAFVDAVLDFGFMRVHIKGKMIEY